MPFVVGHAFLTHVGQIAPLKLMVVVVFSQRLLLQRQLSRLLSQTGCSQIVIAAADAVAARLRQPDNSSSR